MNQIVENLSLKAWSAFESIDNNGWLLRFADGYTKRVNSVTVLDNVDSDLEAKISDCESKYWSRHQIPIFRLLSFNNPHDLDLKLASRGYRVIDPTLVMGLTLSASARSRNTTTLYQENLHDWLAIYDNLNPSEKEQSYIHHRILAAIDSETLFASLKQNEKMMACGIGILALFYHIGESKI